VFVSKLHACRLALWSKATQQTNSVPAFVFLAQTERILTVSRPKITIIGFWTIVRL
jgi:hypothetical protein